MATTTRDEEIKKDDLANLKRLLIAFKKKHELTVSELGMLKEKVEEKESLSEENRALCQQLAILKARVEQIQRDAANRLEDASHHVELTEALRLQKEFQRKYEEADALRASYEEQCLELTRQIHTLESSRDMTDIEKQTLEDLYVEQLHTERKVRDDLEQEIHGLVEKLKENESLKHHLFQTESQKNQLGSTLEELKEQIERDRQKIEKLCTQILEKDRRIQDLQRLEISLKRATEQKQELEEALEAAQTTSKTLEQDKQQLSTQISENQQHAEQLERVIHFLRERSEGARLEAEQMQQEIEKAQQENQMLLATVKASHDAKIELHEEKVALEGRCGQEEREKREALEEIQQLQGQFNELRNHCNTLHKDLEESHALHATALKQHQTLLNKQQELERLLDDKNGCLEEVEKEMALIKQTLIRGLREAKAIQTQYEEAVEEKVATGAKLNQAHHQIDKQREQISLLQDQLEAALDSTKRANGHIVHLQQERETLESRLQQHQEVMRLKEQEHQELLRLCEDVRVEKEVYRDELAQEIERVKEKEAELVQAQHHLAKKMKEASSFEDRCVEQQRLIDEQQQTIQQNKVKLAELQTSVDIQTQQQKMSQEQFLETTKSCDIQLAKWEQKYFALYEKWQAAETHIKDLEKIEEKQKHLQGLLSNLGSFFGNPPPHVPPPVMIQETPVPKPQERHETPQDPSELPPEPSKPYQNLFNMPKPPGRPRQNFLE